MPKLDHEKLHSSIQGLAIRNESAFRKAAATITHTKAAERLGITKQTQNDWNNDQLIRSLQVLAAYDLKLVHRDERTVPPEEMKALLKERIRHAERELVELDGPVTNFGDDSL